MSNNELLTTTLQALINEEQERTADASERLGTFVHLAGQGLVLLKTFVRTVDQNQFVAAALMLAVRKSATLSFLSYIRGHIAQAGFNMRQTIEFSVLTAYMLAHPDEKITKESEDSAVGFKPPKAISGKAYKWINKEYADVSKLLEDMKDQINDTTAHASIYLTHFTFDWGGDSEDKSVFRGSFFDRVDDDVFRLYLMSLARLLVLVIETIVRVNEKHRGFVLQETTIGELQQLSHAVDAHRHALAAKMKMSNKLIK